MGLISSSIRALIPERKMAIAASIPTWEQGNPMAQPSSYYRNAREGYMLDEIVFDCVEFRATSAGEPPICAYRRGSDEKLDQHPAVALLNNPNPFMGRSRFWSTLAMYQDIGGNAYVEKVRSGAGKVVELWPLRPDRIRVIPDRQKFIGGYLYEIGDVRPHVFAPEDIIHFKTRHPLDDFYGLPPIAVIAGRIDLDVWVRHFTEAFFRNAGVPAGLLNIIRQVNTAERENIRRNFREMYGGPDGWHRLMVLDGGQAEYTAMGLPLGADGLAMGDLNDINETRIMGVFGVLPSLIPSMAGSKSGNLAGGNRESDRKLFWESTMIPLFKDLDSTLTMGLADDFPDLDRLEHDLSKVKALQEDEDKKNDRYIKRWQAGLITFKEARTSLGESEKPDEPGMLVRPVNMVETWSEDMLTEPEPEPVPALPGGPGTAVPAPPAPVANGQRNGSGY